MYFKLTPQTSCIWHLIPNFLFIGLILSIYITIFNEGEFSMEYLIKCLLYGTYFRPFATYLHFLSTKVMLSILRNIADKRLQLLMINYDWLNLDFCWLSQSISFPINDLSHLHIIESQTFLWDKLPSLSISNLASK